MKRRSRVGLIVLAVVLVASLPMFTARCAGSGQAGFRGSDNRAQDLVGELSPGYTPWFHVPFKAPSADVEVVIFALQAALGAGFIGYYVLSSRGSSPAGGSSDDD